MPRLLCTVKIKVTCWHLGGEKKREKMNGRACLSRWRDSMNGSGLSEPWGKTDSSNYGSASNEWPWKATETSIPVHTCTYACREHIFPLAVYSHCQALLSWLPPIGSCLFASSKTLCHVCNTIHTQPVKSECIHTPAGNTTVDAVLLLIIQLIPHTFSKIPRSKSHVTGLYLIQSCHQFIDRTIVTQLELHISPAFTLHRKCHLTGMAVTAVTDSSLKNDITYRCGCDVWRMPLTSCNTLLR